MTPDELKKEYPDEDHNGIPDAFENREPISDVLKEIYDSDVRELPPTADLDSLQRYVAPVFCTDRQIYLDSRGRPVEHTSGDKQSLLLGSGQTMPIADALALGIIDQNGTPFWKKK